MDWVRSSLHDHPDVAQQVGLVMGDYALLETLMFMIYAVISGLPGPESFQKFYMLRHSHLREELTCTAAEKLPEPCQKAIKRAWRWFKSAARRRTEIAHCTFLSDGQTITRLRLYRDEPKFEPTDEKVFDRTFTQFRRIGKDLGMLLSELAADQKTLPELLETLPLGQYRKTRPALLGSPGHPAEYGAIDTIASLDRLQLLDWSIEKWKLNGTVPPDYEPPWKGAGLSALKWLQRQRSESI